KLTPKSGSHYTPPLSAECSPRFATDFFRGEEEVLEYYANMLRNRSRAPSSAPGDAQLAAAAGNVRLNYLADINTAETRFAGVGPVTATAPDSLASPPVQEPTVVRRNNPPVRRSLASTASSMASTPPRPSRSSPSRGQLILTSPHVDDDVPLSSDDGTVLLSPGSIGNASTQSAEADEDGEEVDKLHFVLHDMLSLMLHIMLIATLVMKKNATSVLLFGVMDLGDEAEADDVDSGEYGSDGDTSSDPVVEDVGDDPAQTEEEIAAEIVLLTIFFNTFRWEDQVLAGNLKNDILREMSATGWEDVEEPDI
ncbi:hypothetical protein F442_21741, partial [Phytophthora nicotianae P10297]